MDAATTLIGLFGHPVGHSLSPFFMNEALAAIGANCVYLAFDVDERHLGEAVGSLRLFGGKGANVTIPHKQAAACLLDAVDADAGTIGAVNCIVNRGGALQGYNTDHLGFGDTLTGGGFSLRSASAVLIGCGGAARGVLFALVRGGVERVYLVNRTERRALALASWADRSLGFSKVEYVGRGSLAAREGVRDNGPGAEGSVARALAEATLVVNTTPVGMHRAGDPEGRGPSPLGFGAELRGGALVYDLIYNPRKTALLEWAESRGAFTMNGLPMLVRQGLHSLARWFPGREGDIFPLEGRLLGVCERALRRGLPGAAEHTARTTGAER